MYTDLWFARRAALGAFLFLLTIHLALPRPAAAVVFVATDTGIRVFADTATGDVAPLRSIEGGATGLSIPHYLALDLVNRELWVDQGSGSGNDHVKVFSMDDSGNVVPLRDITGNSTHLKEPNGIAVDAEANEVWVANLDSKEIDVFSRTATGNQAPLRSIAGNATLLSAPRGIFLDKVHHELLVSDIHKVLVFDANQSGDVAPIRKLDWLSSGNGLFVDLGSDELTMADGSDGVVTFARTATSGNPLRAIYGDATGLTLPYGLIRTSSQMLVANNGHNGSALDTVTGYAASATGNAAPVRGLAGTNPDLSAPTGLASTRAIGCAAGFVATSCVFQDGFEDGDVCRWATASKPSNC